MSKVTAFSTLINQDLACVSAREAIQHILNYPRVTQLKRFTMWEFEFDGLSISEAESAVSQIFTKTFFLINPNKESFSINELPNLSYSDSLQLGIAVTPKSPVNWANICEKIKNKTGVTVRNIVSSTVWIMSVSRGELSETELKSELSERVIVAGSAKEGILVNPVSETFEWLSSSTIGTKAIA